MVDRTSRLGTPLIRAGQATQEPLYNELAQRLDIAATLTFLDFDLNTPPGSPADGDTYKIGGAPTGVWAAHANEIAIGYNSSWYYINPASGGKWTAFVEDDKEWRGYDQVQDAWYPLMIRDSDPASGVAAEHFTGRYRGTSKVYGKTIDFGALPNNTTKTVAHSITNLDLNYLRAPILVVSVTNGTTVYDGAQGALGVTGLWAINATNVTCQTNGDLTTWSGYVRLEYCRT